jgi:hypothetical protein
MGLRASATAARKCFRAISRLPLRCVRCPEQNRQLSPRLYACSIGSAAGTAAQGWCTLNRRRNFQKAVLLGLVLSLAAVLVAQSVPDKTLLVNGKPTGAVVHEIDGRSYVDVESLALITNGTLTFEADRVVLTIPDARSARAPGEATAPGLSGAFANAAIAAVAGIQQWEGALRTMVTYGLAFSGAWAQSYQDQVAASITQASMAASTDFDRNALEMLNNEYGNLTNWASKLNAERQALDGSRTVDPNALKNDAAMTKITDCSSRLGAMLVSGDVVDEPSCH